MNAEMMNQHKIYERRKEQRSIYEFESVYINIQDDFDNMNNNINSGEEVIIKTHDAKDDINIIINFNNDVCNSDVAKQNHHDNYNINNNNNNNEKKK